MRILGAGALTGPVILEGKGEGSCSHAKDITDTEVIKSYHDMTIPEDQLERTIRGLCDLVEMRTSNCFAVYEKEDLEMCDLDMEEAKSVRTVLDVIRFLCHLGRDHLMDYYYLLDTVGNFGEDNLDEDLFRDYLVNTYGIDPTEFPYRN